MSMEKIGSSENIFGKSLRSVRKALGKTQTEFASSLSISGSYVSDLEKGKAVPSEAVLKEMISEYRIIRRFLETGQGEMFQTKVGGDTEQTAEGNDGSGSQGLTLGPSLEDQLAYREWQTLSPDQKLEAIRLLRKLKAES